MDLQLKVHMLIRSLSLEDAMNDSDIVVHWVPAQQHVPEIERTIRTAKDRHRCAHHNLPFQAIPKVMIKALARRVVKFVNMFPPKGGVSEYWSPRAIVTGRPLDYNASCICPFGSFLEASHEPSPSIAPAPRSLDAIYLDDNDDSLAGGHKTMHLASGKEIARPNVTPVPMTEEAVKRVEALAKKDGIPTKLSFFWT